MWTWWDWSLSLGTLLPSVLWHCWLGHLTRKNRPEMTYNVFSGTLNPTYFTFGSSFFVKAFSSTVKKSEWVIKWYFLLNCLILFICVAEVNMPMKQTLCVCVDRAMVKHLHCLMAWDALPMNRVARLFSCRSAWRTLKCLVRKCSLMTKWSSSYPQMKSEYNGEMIKCFDI